MKSDGVTVARAVGPLLAAGGLSGQPEPLCGRCASLTACDATGDALRYLVAAKPRTFKVRKLRGAVLNKITRPVLFVL